MGADISVPAIGQAADRPDMPRSRAAPGWLEPILRTIKDPRARSTAQLIDPVAAPSTSRWREGERRDGIVALGLAALIGLAVYGAIVTLDPRFIEAAHGNDVWFEGDLPRVFDEMTHRWAAHSRAPVHPVFSLLASVAVYAMRALGLTALQSVALTIACGAAAWIVLLFLVVRLVTPSRAEALLFTAAGATTSAALFWLAVPETYVFGSATMLAAVWLAMLAERRRVSEGWFVAVSAGTLAVTVTNWMAGIAATATRWPWRRSLQITVNAFAVVVALWAVQRLMIPRADFFIGYSNEQRYLLRPEAGGPGRILTVLFSHAVVMPSIAAREKPGRGTVMSVQNAGWAAGGRLRLLALTAWFAWLSIGLYDFLRSLRASSAMRTVAVVTVAEISLHLLYGTETFLYSLNLVPLFIVIAARGSRTRLRRVVTLLALTMLVCGSISNVRAWLWGRHFFESALYQPATRGDANRGAAPNVLGTRPTLGQ